VLEVGFFVVFRPKFLSPWSMQITSIYRWWKRDILSLLVLNVGLGSAWKHSNYCFKEVIMNCQFCAGKWLVGLATLGRCRCLCSLDKSKRFTLACSKVSQDCFRAVFI
jgi:hypothetical protein